MQALATVDRFSGSEPDPESESEPEAEPEPEPEPVPEFGLQRRQAGVPAGQAAPFFSIRLAMKR